MKVLCLSVALMLCGCGGVAPKYTVVSTVRPVCEKISVICISKDDVLTPETARQMRADNVGLRALCKQKKVC